MAKWTEAEMLQIHIPQKGYTVKFTFSIKYKKPPFSVIPQQQGNGGTEENDPIRHISSCLLSIAISFPQHDYPISSFSSPPPT